jgi:pimeloyl-ACP methyl ester carboxylesterase
MFTSLSHALAAAGKRTIAVDWCGPRALRTITSDVEAVIAVHEAFVAERRVDPARVALFGHSLGALVAALAASVVSVAGVVVYGAAARRFADALEVGAARQLPLRGFAADQAAREASMAGVLYRAVLRDGASRRSLAAASPARLACVAAADLTDDTLFGATLGYLRSVDAIEPEAAWRGTSCAVRAIQGGFDWTVGAGDAPEIAGWSRAGAAEIVPRADHCLLEHANLASSMHARGAGRPSRGATTAVVASCDVLLNHAHVART